MRFFTTNPLRNLVLVGVFTWLVLAAPHVTWLWHDGTLATARGFVWLAAYVAFLPLFLRATSERCHGVQETFALAAQSLLALICIAIEPRGFVAVLLVIVAGQLGFQPVRPALAAIAAQSAVMTAILERREGGLVTAFAWTMFQFFGFFAARTAHEEREAKRALAQANAELRVATRLLDLNSRTEERLRIARDLHDLIGHHLTALTLNLEVASHVAEGPAREQIEKAKSLAKLLLNDVRDVVSRLRADEPIDLGAALESLRQAVPSPAIHVENAGATRVNDPAVAETALRAVQEIVTNAVRHSGARNLWLRLASDDGRLIIAARDDGAGTDRVEYGNGLRGMRERVQQNGGTLEIASMQGRGFEVTIALPLERHAA